MNEQMIQIFCACMFWLGQQVNLYRAGFRFGFGVTFGIMTAYAIICLLMKITRWLTGT